MAPASLPDINELLERLAGLYGSPVHRPNGDPMAELVLTVLSQNTSDTNSGRAFARLLRTYGSWGEVATAPVEDVIATIQVGGLANQKGPRLGQILEAVEQRSPEWDLSFLSDIPLEEARAWLRSLPGVGPKTAACVLLFAVGLPAMPVDTHVERVAKRLGLIAEKTSAVQAHEQLEALVSPAEYYRFHMLLIKHGRRTCAARSPRCEACPVEQMCPSSRMRAEVPAS